MEQKVAFCCQSPGGLNSTFDFRFGRCAGFTIVILDGNAVKSVNFIENPAAQAFGGAGIQSASLVGGLSLTALVVGFLGPNAAMALKNIPGLKILSLRNDKPYSVKDALDQYLAGALTEVKDATVGAHFGMGGGGRGMGGGGRGQGFGMQ